MHRFEVAVITVPTPHTDRVPDLTCVRDAAQLLATRMEPGATVVLESTTHPGATRDVLIPNPDSRSGHRAPGAGDHSRARGDGPPISWSALLVGAAA
ncbi:hypothetical protein OG453_37785 [Streptomyces sp. NBC_01381]|uniref:hypothetical protein n=1 Tax=Streptomyces sp. NBC_01381 TaxID=2903845 RepID=UPI0022576C3C|nr:hypothetical protein [Streptomyces sp. NBC_01381]MCX4672350.1 hypothetical protein [Streptomyces sp. NBC_01381]